LNEINTRFLAPILTGIILFALTNGLKKYTDHQKQLENKKPNITTPVVIMPNRNKRFFTGRKKKLKEIQETLKEKGAIVISGLGGIGKTQVALEYAYRHKNKYDSIGWMNAETETMLFASFQNFALRNKIIKEDTKEAKIIINEVRDWMQKHDNWLFIYDNAPDEKTLEPYLPAQNEGRRHVLITSRNTHFPQYDFLEDFYVFTEQEACKFIKKYTHKPADEHFKKLAKIMGYFP